MNNREKILTEAIKLIGEKGYDAVSIRQITGKVGIKESSFYNHFSGKQKLLEEIFHMLQKDLGQTRISQEEIKKLARQLNLKEFLEFRLKKFLGGWSNETARLLWYVVSHQQYKHKQASKLIVEETEKSISMFETAFKIFMEEGKMKKGDAHFLAMLYGYSIRAIHLDYTYRHFAGLQNDNDFSDMYSLMDNFSETYSI